jgi:hypothetical protein
VRYQPSKLVMRVRFPSPAPASRSSCPWTPIMPRQTVYGYFAAWRDDGTLARLHDAHRGQARDLGHRGDPAWASTRI